VVEATGERIGQARLCERVEIWARLSKALLTGTMGRLTGAGRVTRVVTDGRPLIFDATAISAKLYRLRAHREDLAVKRDHCQARADGLGPSHPEWEKRTVRARVLAVEHQRVCARIRHLNSALAWAAARWAVNHALALALGASVIYLEDLATLEARGHRRGNARLSGQVRGTVIEAIGHLAAKAGIVVVTVPARGTSAQCPTCLRRLSHHPAPDRTGERGWKWARCTQCGLSLDRDHAAARRIVSRGLLAQTRTTTDRTTTVRAIRTTVDGTVSTVRRQKETTRRLRRQRRAETAPPRTRGPRATPGKGRPTPTGSQTCAPDVRTVPATTLTRAVKRPAGHDTQAPTPAGPVPGREVPAPYYPEREIDLRVDQGRLSRGTCRQRTRAAQRTGFHQLHATEVHFLTPRFGPRPGDRTWPRRARNA
jgi:hypothetical protein